MSCRHDLANGTCTKCYPDNPYGRLDRDRVDPGPEEGYAPNLDGPGAVQASTESGISDEAGSRNRGSRCRECGEVGGHEKSCREVEREYLVQLQASCAHDGGVIQTTGDPPGPPRCAKCRICLPAVPADLSGLAREVGFEVVAWDEDHGAISGHGVGYVGTHAELRAFASAWRDCASFMRVEFQKSSSRSSGIVHRVLSLRSYHQIANNEVFRVVARPQVTPFRGMRIAVPDEIAARFEIVDLLVGGRSQTPTSGPVSATLYAARLMDRALLYCDRGMGPVQVSIAVDATAEFGRAVSFDACQDGMEVTVAARLLPGSPPTEFEAIVLGLGVEYGDRSSAERRAAFRGRSQLRGRAAAEALMSDGVPGRYTSNVDDHDE